MQTQKKEENSRYLGQISKKAEVHPQMTLRTSRQQDTCDAEKLPAF